jgi:hypothetical protein
MATNLKCNDTHYFPNQPSPGFASKAPQIMPVEGICYPNLKLGIYAKPNVLYGSWQIPEILPRDPARPDVQHFLQMEARCCAAVHLACTPSDICSSSFLVFQARKSPPAYAYKDTPQHPAQPQPDSWDTKHIQLRDTTPLERHGTVVSCASTISFAPALNRPHRRRCCRCTRSRPARSATGSAMFCVSDAIPSLD